jgi:hypothetical protein
MIHVECDVMTVKRVEGRFFSVHSFPIFSGKQRHAIFFSAVYVHCHCCFFGTLMQVLWLSLCTSPIFLHKDAWLRSYLCLTFMKTTRLVGLIRLGTWTRNCMHLYYDCTQKDQQKWSTVLSFGINTTNVSDFSRMSHIRVSDYCLTPTQFFSYRYIMARTSFDEMMMRYALY